MKYLIDAQLTYKLSKHLKNKGFDVVHTNELPKKEFTTDAEIRLFSQKEERIVITKDTDFLDSYVLMNKPRKLLLITTGNLKNVDLMSLFDSYFNEIDSLFQTNSFIEMNQFEIIVHE